MVLRWIVRIAVIVLIGLVAFLLLAPLAPDGSGLSDAREAFVLYYEGGLSQAEVAKVVGKDPKTLRKRIAEVHRFIDRLLARTKGAPSSGEFFKRNP